MTVGSLTNYGASLYLNHVFGTTAKANHTPHIGYFLSAASINGPGSEPTSGNYARVPILPANMTPASAGSIQTAVDLEANRASGEWGRIIGLGIFDSSVGGNCLAFSNFAAEELVKKNGQLVLLAGGYIHRFVAGGGFSEYLQNLILDDLYRQIPIPTFPTLYSASYTTPATITAGTEPIGNGYARVPIANNGTNFGPTVGNVKTNNVSIDYAQATGLWGDISHTGLHTDSTGGLYLAGGAISATTTIDNLDTLRIGAGLMSLSLR